MLRPLTCITMLLLVAGCTAPQIHFVYEIPGSERCHRQAARQGPRLIDEQDDSYFVWAWQGRLYVLGSPQSSRAFADSKELTQWQLEEGLGPHGVDVLFESVPDKPELFERLRQQFNEPQLLRYRYDDLYVWKSGRVITLFGDLATQEHYLAFREFPPERESAYGVGPQGENVVYQVKMSKPDYGKFLLQRFLELPELISEPCADVFIWKYLGRYYVMASQQSSLRFEKELELRNSRAFLGLGPGGETVVIEDQKSDWLRQRFLQLITPQQGGEQ